MKIKDIEVGATYAYRDSKYSSPSRVLVVSTETYREAELLQIRGRGVDFVKHTRGDRKAPGCKSGILVIQVPDEVTPEELAELTNLSVEAVLSTKARETLGEVGVAHTRSYRRKVVGLAQLIDGWEAHLASEEKAQEARKLHLARKAEEDEENLRRANAIADVIGTLTEHRPFVSSFASRKMELSLDDLEVLTSVVKAALPHLFKKDADA